MIQKAFLKYAYTDSDTDVSLEQQFQYWILNSLKNWTDTGFSGKFLRNRDPQITMKYTSLLFISSIYFILKINQM